MDQAAKLRQIVQETQPRRLRRHRLPSSVRAISITSGKGGVGKTNTVLNLSIALSSLRRRVFLLDADMGLANVDVLLGLTPRYTLEHVVKGEKLINDVILDGPHGLKILPSSSGISELSELKFEEQARLFRELGRIEDEIDYLFIDTGAGISSNVMRFNASASEVYVVVNPEPTSITDAYAMIKLLTTRYKVKSFGLIANSVSSEKDGQAVYDRLNRACSEFLQVGLTYLGCIPFDPYVRKAIRQQKPVLEAYPVSRAGKAFLRLAARIDQGLQTGHPSIIPPPDEAAPSMASSPQEFPPAQASTTNPDALSTSRGFWDRLLHFTPKKSMRNVN